MITNTYNLLRNVRRHSSVIAVLARREFAARYVGTLGGFVWSVLQPLATVGVFWFVFAVGFKAQGPDGTPFVLYFLCGLIPWLTFSEVLNTSVSAISGSAYLVKKVAFPTEILPLVHIIAASIAHAILLSILLIMLVLEGYALAPSMVIVVYYYLALCVIALGLSWTLSALNVFSRDVSQIVTAVLNLWFWLTPIAWSGHLLPPEYEWVISINPIYYVVDGYRSTLLYHAPPFANAVNPLYFWLVALGCFCIGAFIFRRLKPEFADAL